MKAVIQASDILTFSNYVIDHIVVQLYAYKMCDVGIRYTKQSCQD